MTSIEGFGLVLSSVEAVGMAVELETLVPAYSLTLFRVAHAVLRNPSEAEDVVQETFLRVVRHRHKLAGVQDMRVWLIRIAWNLALDRKRQHAPEQMDEAFALRLASADAPVDRAHAEACELKAVLAEMDRLPKAERHVLLLSAVEEMKTAEIAAVLGKSESAVRALLFRARMRLRERVDRRSK